MRGLAKSTRRAYASKVRKYVGFCERAGLTAFPATEPVLCAFVGSRLVEKPTLAVGTINGDLCAIASLHHDFGLDSRVHQFKAL